MATLVKETLGLTLPNVSTTTTNAKSPATVDTREIPESPAENVERAGEVTPEKHREAQAMEARQDSAVTAQDLIITSPYTELSHQLHLSTLDIQSALLARALTAFEFATPSYATASYETAIKWPLVMERLRDLCAEEGHTWSKQTFYAVAFFSKLQEGVDRDLLYQLDKESHREAVESGGLLMYYFGSPNEERRNLATCMWRSEKDAKLGGTGPWHKRARLEARNLYETIEFKRMDFIIEDGVSGYSIE
ncbi:hypothetical protein NA57DRAFT_57145 [Rhizodiscina lignyota]|uniref:Uncharacterized protein n=1 Tax=Rhizodiscina lignyota TaxID=1504668 RepID=A0A9P4IER5_9PEZI|nr:hypothetical protein NA57DRAFT_57145 [Rhizodiscina lignyota]